MSSSNHHLATLGGGCFWCLEAVYQEVEGVPRVVSGYAGGHLPNPTYQQVCLEVTGHAEVVQLTFDPNVVPYDRRFSISSSPSTIRPPQPSGSRSRHPVPLRHLLSTIRNRNDAPSTSIAELNRSGLWNQPIVTTVSPLTDFYPAEDYHQNYFRQQPVPTLLSGGRPPEGHRSSATSLSDNRGLEQYHFA
jgi:peptide-methionine (S)-S-oxide reductase